MKKVIAAVITVFSFSGLFALESAAIRVDTRMESGAFGGRLGTSVEAVGEPDGSYISSWVTTNMLWDGSREFPDGWHIRTSQVDWAPLPEGQPPERDVLLLNDIAVLGGRLASNEVWAADCVRVIRHNVVIPSGITLTIEPEAVVKFASSARIVTEGSGRLVAKGAWFAELTDDEWVGGDTNLDGTNTVATGTQDWIAGMDPDDYVHCFLLDGAEQIFPTRTYTRGEVYGNLPTVDRYDEGWFFRGWVTNLAETVSVTAGQLAEMDCDAIYCNWEAIYLNVSTGLLSFAAYSVDEVKTVEIDSNDDWVYSTEADWLHLSVSDSTITVTADQNRSEVARSSVIVVSRENGRLVHEISVVQAAMEHAAQPHVFTADGQTVFHDFNLQVRMTCATPGTMILYTTDESEPSAENGMSPDLTWTEADGTVCGEIQLFGSTTLKVVAVREDLLDSAVTTVRFTRQSTLAEAMDLDSEKIVNTSGDADWFVTTEDSVCGPSCVRSGPMQTSPSSRRYSRISTVFFGKGVLKFKFKISCEHDYSNRYGLDYLICYVDNKLIKQIDGNSGWEEVVYNITSEYGETSGEGHRVEWVYSKNGGFEDRDPGEDCAWIDEVVWTPSIFSGSGDNAQASYVNSEWLLRVGLVGAFDGVTALEDSLNADDDGDGFTNEEEALLGTDPHDPNSKLQAIMYESDGVRKVEPSPVNNTSADFKLVYKIMGAQELGTSEDQWKDVSQMSEIEREYRGYRFFKVKVEVKDNK